MTNGVFDTLHTGHLHFLETCAQLGDYLLVAINSDSSVKKLKGDHRPYVSELDRKRLLLALECVDEVVIFPEGNASESINMFRPEIYAKSDEYLNTPLPEFEKVREYGGKIAIVTPAKEYRDKSTSELVDRIYKTEYKRRMEGQA